MAKNLERRVENSEGLVRVAYNSARSAVRYVTGVVRKVDDYILGAMNGQGRGRGIPGGGRRNQNPEPCYAGVGPGYGAGGGRGAGTNRQG